MVFKWGLLITRHRLTSTRGGLYRFFVTTRKKKNKSTYTEDPQDQNPRRRFGDARGVVRPAQRGCHLDDDDDDDDANSKRRFVDARVIARHYSVTSRYILQLAADGRIPSLRVGKKCVRFNESAVAAALEKEAD